MLHIDYNECINAIVAFISGLGVIGKRCKHPDKLVINDLFALFIQLQLFNSILIKTKLTLFLVANFFKLISFKQLIEFQKSLRGKTLMKNFSNTKVVLVTTIPAQKSKPE
jgi:hypothetical protein